MLYNWRTWRSNAVPAYFFICSTSNFIGCNSAAGNHLSLMFTNSFKSCYNSCATFLEIHFSLQVISHFNVCALFIYLSFLVQGAWQMVSSLFRVCALSIFFHVIKFPLTNYYIMHFIYFKCQRKIATFPLLQQQLAHSALSGMKWICYTSNATRFVLHE